MLIVNKHIDMCVYYSSAACMWLIVIQIHELSLEPSPMQVVQKHPPLQTYLKVSSI